MASFEDRRNAKVQALIMKQHDYVARHQTNMDQLKQRKNIKISQIARQAEYEATQFRNAAASRPEGVWNPSTSNAWASWNPGSPSSHCGLTTPAVR